MLCALSENIYRTLSSGSQNTAYYPAFSQSIYPTKLSCALHQPNNNNTSLSSTPQRVQHQELCGEAEDCSRLATPS